VPYFLAELLAGSVKNEVGVNPYRETGSPLRRSEGRKFHAETVRRNREPGLLRNGAAPGWVSWWVQANRIKIEPALPARARRAPLKYGVVGWQESDVLGGDGQKQRGSQGGGQGLDCWARIGKSKTRLAAMVTSSKGRRADRGWIAGRGLARVKRAWQRR
jgi:hypothetical protein